MSIVFGCEIKYACRLVYGKKLDLNAPDPTLIGINCRLCDRPACPQRALRPLQVDETMRSISPFTFNDV